MKHLRKFFEEVNDQEYEELKDFCEMYLAYLTDEGWNISVTQKLGDYPVRGGYYDVFIWINYSNDGNPRWPQIADQFIPFFKVLLDNYSLIPSVGRSMIDGSPRYNLVEFSGSNRTREEILGNLIPDNQPVRKIMFKVKGKL